MQACIACTSFQLTTNPSIVSREQGAIFGVKKTLALTLNTWTINNCRFDSAYLSYSPYSTRTMSEVNKCNCSKQLHTVGCGYYNTPYVVKSPQNLANSKTSRNLRQHIPYFFSSECKNLLLKKTLEGRRLKVK